jgi:hypothetical protein
MPESAEFLKQVLDHIVALQHRGATSSENLAECCGHCNSNKGPNLSGIDPKTGRHVALFHPRRDIWRKHFRWRNARLVGLTPKGRTTIEVLKINDENRIAVRERLIISGQFSLLE